MTPCLKIVMSGKVCTLAMFDIFSPNLKKGCRQNVSGIFVLTSGSTCFACKGSLQIGKTEKFGILSQLGGGGGLPIPNFDPIFPRVFLLQYGRGSPVPTNKITKKSMLGSSLAYFIELNWPRIILN